MRGRELETVIVPDGERHKTLATFTTVIDRLIDARFHRDCCLVALGGGVDRRPHGLRGRELPARRRFRASADDAARAGRLFGRRQDGRQPSAREEHDRRVPSADRRAGRHQHAALRCRRASSPPGSPRSSSTASSSTPPFFAWLETHIDDLKRLDAAALTHAIRRSCEIKAAIVAEDEREQGRRALLNLGHTFGHALEAIGNYERWLHGEAVAVGIGLAARTSVALGWLPLRDCERIERLLERAGLPTAAPGVDRDELLDHMRGDKKADRAGLKLILIRALGEAVVTRSPPEDALRAVLAEQLR